MLKMLFIYFSICISLNSFAQTTFQKTFGDVSNDKGEYILQLDDGGYIIAGTKWHPSSGDDIFLVRLNVNGDSIWTKSYQGLSYGTGYSIQQCADSGFIIGGRMEPTNSNGCLLKVDQNGNFLWVKSYGGSSHPRINDAIQTTDGGFLMTGVVVSFGGDRDVYLVKTDSAGLPIWEKYVGGSDEEYGESIQQTTDGGYIIAGYSRSFSNGFYDIYLIKMDSNDSILWTKVIGDALNDYGYSVQQTTDGGYIICGSTQCCNPGGTKTFLVKSDSNGDSLWTKAYGDIYYNEGYFVQQTTDGGYIITGTTMSSPGNPQDVYLIKTDLNGDLLWSKAFGGSTTDLGKCVQQTMDGGYVIVGSIDADLYVIKTDSMGNSGCNEFNAVTSVYFPPTQFSSPPIISTSFGPGGAGNGFNDMGSGSFMTTLCYVGLNELNKNEHFVLSPNPSTGKFRVSFEKSTTGTIEIFNIIGEMIFTESIFNESDKEIDLSYCADGIFILRVQNGSGCSIQKLIIRKN